jgi:hypothetical protein
VANDSGQVDTSKIPPFPKARPDFLATGPHVLIKEGISLQQPVEDEEQDTIDDVEEELGATRLPIRYYESSKVIGKLYRAIDEHLFFDELRQRAHAPIKGGIIRKVWSYVEREVRLMQWEHHESFAFEIREK